MKDLLAIDEQMQSGKKPVKDLLALDESKALQAPEAPTLPPPPPGPGTGQDGALEGRGLSGNEQGPLFNAVGFTPESLSSGLTALKDIGLEAGASAMSIPKAVGYGIEKLAPVSREEIEHGAEPLLPFVSGLHEPVKKAGQYIQEQADAAAQGIQGFESPEMKAAHDLTLSKGYNVPEYWQAKAGQMAPTVGLIAASGGASAGLEGLGVPAQIAKALGPGLVWGADMAAQGGMSAREIVDSIPEGDLLAIPRYQELLNQWGDPVKAREEFSKLPEALSMLSGGATGALTALVPGGKAPIRSGLQGLGAMYGIGAEGKLQQNALVKSYLNPDQPLLQGVNESGLESAIIGGPFALHSAMSARALRQATANLPPEINAEITRSGVVPPEVEAAKPGTQQAVDDFLFKKRTEREQPPPVEESPTRLPPPDEALFGGVPMGEPVPNVEQKIGSLSDISARLSGKPVEPVAEAADLAAERINRGDPPPENSEGQIAAPDPATESVIKKRLELLPEGNEYFGERDIKFLDAETEGRNLQQKLVDLMGDTRRRILSGLTRQLYPGPQYREMADALRRWRDMSPEDRIKHADLITPQEKAAFDAIDQSPELQAIAKDIADQYHQEYLQANEAGVLHNELENYSSRSYVGKRGQDESRSQFRTRTRHQNQRKFSSWLDARANGYELAPGDAIKDLVKYKKEMATVIESRKMLDAMLNHVDPESGKPILMTDKGGIPDGYEKVDHPGFSKWEPVGKAEKTYDKKNLYTDEKGTLWEKKDLYAHPALAKQLDTLLSSSWFRKQSPFKQAIAINSSMKSALFTFSFFHHQALLRSYLLGTPGKSLAEWNPKAAFNAGREAILSKNPVLRSGVKAGLTLSFDAPDYSVADVTRMPGGKAMAAGNQFLWGELMPYLKAQSYLLRLRWHMEKFPTAPPEEAIKKVADWTNHDFGGEHFERMGISKSMQDALRLMLLAPDWTVSNVMTLPGSVKGGAEGKMYRRYWMHVVAASQGATIASNLLLSFLDDKSFAERYMAAWNAGRLKWMTVDVTPLYRLALDAARQEYDYDDRKYFSIIGHFADPFKWIAHPPKSFSHKASPISRFISALLSGQDWKGSAYTTLPELIGKDQPGTYKTSGMNKKGEYHYPGQSKGGKLVGQMTKREYGNKEITWENSPSFMLEQLRSNLPIPMQNLLTWLEGERDGFDSLTNAAGFMTSSARPRPGEEQSRYQLPEQLSGLPQIGGGHQWPQNNAGGE